MTRLAPNRRGSRRRVVGAGSLKPGPLRQHPAWARPRAASAPRGARAPSSGAGAGGPQAAWPRTQPAQARTGAEGGAPGGGDATASALGSARNPARRRLDRRLSPRPPAPRGLPKRRSATHGLHAGPLGAAARHAGRRRPPGQHCAARPGLASRRSRRPAPARAAPHRAPPAAREVVSDAAPASRGRGRGGAARSTGGRGKRAAAPRSASSFGLSRNANRSRDAPCTRHSHPGLEGRHCASGGTLAATAAPGSRAGGANGMPIRAAQAATSGRRATARRPHRQILGRARISTMLAPGQRLGAVVEAPQLPRPSRPLRPRAHDPPTSPTARCA